MHARPSHLSRALAFASPHRASLSVICALTLASGAAAAGEPWVFGRLFDALQEAPGAVPAWVGWLAALEIGRQVLTHAGTWLTWRTRIVLHQELLDVAVTRLEHLPLRVYADKGVGELVTRMDRGVQGLVTALSEIAFHTVPALVYLTLSVVLMARSDLRLTALVLAFVPLPALVGAVASVAQTRRERLLLDRWSQLYGRLHEVLHGILTVRSFGTEDLERSRFLRGLVGTNEVVLRGLRFDTAVGLLQGALVTGGRLAAIGLGAHLVLTGSTSSGTVLAFVGYVAGLFGPVQGLTGGYQTVRRARASLEAVFELLDTHPDPAPAATPVPLPRVRGRIDLEGVRYTHDGERWALDGVQLTVEPGEHVALVGPSGSGKTTLINLVQRLVDPTEGVVRLDGHDLRSLDLAQLRRHLGVVLQDGVLFDDTVRANLTYGRPDASAEEIVEAARAACAHDFITELPLGYDTVVGPRGLRLSVGQRQRIAIGRALLKDPTVLILDEATSALDADSEAAVQEALRRLTRGRTTLTVAHRLVTVARADRIVVLEAGRVVEVGTHRELAGLGERYAALLRRQQDGLAA